ncbi:unnamed protein product [Linum trigynum]|uniref:Uncharacterized protein n=1 Tax=Linum trigynum TaxID=586398 RepID=A0AAV2E5E0_9ROSI
MGRGAATCALDEQLTKLPLGRCHTDIGTDVMLPIEMELSSYRIQPFHPDENQIKLTHDLHLIEERREYALMLLVASKERIARYLNVKVRNRPIWEGEWVLRRNFKKIQSHGNFTP